jgi:hypothetical protein
MRRQCGRPGCSTPATVTFTFDATRCVVWLNAMADGTPRAGDLCTRHADGLVPPQGWQRVDRRPTAKPAPTSNPAPLPASAGPVAPEPAPAQPTTPPVIATPLMAADAKVAAPTPGRGDDLLPQRRKRRKRWSEVPSLFEHADGELPDDELPDGVQHDDHGEGIDDIASPAVAPPVEPVINAVAEPVVETVVESGAPVIEPIVQSAPAGGATEPSWLPRLASDDDLDGVLDADTPLLARAFRNARPGPSTPTDG